MVVMPALATSACNSVLGIHELPPGDAGADATVVDGMASDVASDSISDGTSPEATCDADTTSDPINCGYCGHGCDNGTCSQSMCQPVRVTTSNISYPWAVRVSSGTAYITAGYDGGMVLAVSTAGGAPAPLATGRASPGQRNQLVVGTEYVYWADDNDGGTVTRVALDGGSLATLVAERAAGIAVGAGYLYWTHSLDGTVNGVPVDGGAPMQLQTGIQEPGAMATEASNFVWLEYYDAGGVYSVPFANPMTRPTLVAQDQDLPAGVALMSGQAYWVDEGSGMVWTGSTAQGAGPPAMLASGQNRPTSIAVDMVNAYWTNTGDGTVMAIALSGGTPIVLAKGQASPASVALDNRSVYWVDSAVGVGGMGALWTVPKP